jgi:hypothetical protein
MSRLIGLLGKSGLRTQIGVHLAGVSVLEGLTPEPALCKLGIDHDALADHTTIQNDIRPRRQEDFGDPGSLCLCKHDVLMLHSLLLISGLLSTRQTNSLECDYWPNRATGSRN